MLYNIKSLSIKKNPKKKITSNAKTWSNLLGLLNKIIIPKVPLKSSSSTCKEATFCESNTLNPAIKL